jgi:23S rRNA pseudouridine955/2504/2580 synthase
LDAAELAGVIDKNPLHFLQIDEHHAGQRIDNFLITKLKGLPKSRLYRVLRKGEVRVNKKRIKPDYRLQIGDIVRVPPLRLSAPATENKKPSLNTKQTLLDRIVYEDKNILIINKPFGIAVHGGSGVSFGVIETLRHGRPQEKFLELAHRLDRDTSGCLMLAKKSSVLKELHELLRNGKITKIYLALVKGHWPKQVHVIDAPLKKDQLRSGERMVNVDQEGKFAVTEFRVIQRFENSTLVEATLKTGRTHQIRVHAAHAGHPITGDEKYGDKEFNKQLRAHGCKRLFLHAASLNFILPSTGQSISVKAGLEADLKKCLANLLQTSPS